VIRVNGNGNRQTGLQIKYVNENRNDSKNNNEMATKEFFFKLK